MKYRLDRLLEIVRECIPYVETYGTASEGDNFAKWSEWADEQETDEGMARADKLIDRILAELTRG